MKRRLDRRIGLGKSLVDVAGIEHALEGEIVAKLGMDHRGVRLERGLRLRHGGQHVIVDADQRAGVLGLSAGPRHHRAHRLALPASALHRDGVLRRRFEALQMGQHADPRRDHLGQFGAGNHRDNAGRLFRRRRLDGFDAGMGMRRAHEGGVHHTRQHDVADILAAPLGQPRQIGPRHRAADIGVRPIERGQTGRLVVGDFHFCLLPPLAGQGPAEWPARWQAVRGVGSSTPKPHPGIASLADPPPAGEGQRKITNTGSATSGCATYALTGCCRSRGLPPAA